MKEENTKYTEKERIQKSKEKIVKRLSEYEVLLDSGKVPDFSSSDLSALYEMSRGEFFDLVIDSLRYGFMVGYRKRQREEAKKRREARR